MNPLRELYFYREVHAAKTEGQLEKATKKCLQELGCIVEKYKTPNKRGAPDDIVIDKNGWVFFIEFKSPTGSGELTPLQKVAIGKIRRNHVDVFVVSCALEAIHVIERVENA